MIHCPFCQSENDEKSKFCSNCGGLLVNEPKEEAPIEDQPLKELDPIRSEEDEWQTVGQTSSFPGTQAPPPPPPGVPPQHAPGFQAAPQVQAQAPFAPPPAYPPAPQSPKKSNKGLLIGLLVGGLLLLGICITLILVITNAFKKKVNEGMQSATWIVGQLEEKGEEVLETMQAPLPTETDETGESDLITEPIEGFGYKLLLEDNFGSESIFESFEEFEASGVLGDNRFELNVNQKNYLGWKTTQVVNVQNVVLQADAEKVTAAESDSYGLICRYIDVDNYIQAEVSHNGWVAIRKIVNGEEMRLMERRLMGISEAKNTFTFACVDDLLTVFVNGNQVTIARDPSPVSGDIGMVVGRFSDSPSKVAFSHFQAFEVEPGKSIVKLSDLPFTQTHKSLLAYEGEGYFYQNDLLTEADGERLGYGETEFSKVAWEDGKYIVGLKDINRFKIMMTTELNYMDMVVSVTIPEFDHDALVGVVCRYQSVDDFYALAVANDGWTTIFKYVHGEYEELYGQNHENVFPAGENTISGICVGNELRLLVNGEVVAFVTDDDLLSGDGGILTQSYKDSPVNVQYKYFFVNPVR